MIDIAVQIYAEICRFAVPVAFIFSLGNLIVGTVLRTAFGGKLEIKI